MSFENREHALDAEKTDEQARAQGHERLVLRRVALFFIVHVLAAFALLTPSWSGLAAFTTMHFLAGCLGISVGFHRLLAHRAFEAPRPVVFFLGLCGVLALQGGPLTWVALHRSHHRWSDRPGDPHSAARGFAWCHMLWTVYDAPNGFTLPRSWRQLADLRNRPELRFLEHQSLEICLAASVICLGVLGWQATLWAFPLRIAISWHSAWLVNSVGHGASLLGTREEPSPLNLPWLAALTYGEGFHANHHRCPYAARFSSTDAQIDPGYGVIRALYTLGLARPRLSERSIP